MPSKTKTISWFPNLYHGWPTLTRRSNGELLLVYSGGREAHVCPFGRVELTRSSDEGETWSFPRVVLSGPIDDRDAGVLETAKGSILVTSFSSVVYQNYMPEDERKRRRWEAAHNRLDEEGRGAALGTWMIRSTDGGETFSDRYAVPVNSPHGPVQLSDGRLLYAGKAIWGSEKAGICISEDDGVTWDWIADIPLREGDEYKNYHELHAVETNPGHIIVQIRNHNPQNNQETIQCESDDGGKTWTTPEPIGVWGLPSHLLRLRDGRLLMSYGYRREPYGNLARVSSDKGKSWSGPISISSDGIGYDLGYPSTVELDDGQLLTVWYERMEGSKMAVLRQSRWEL